MAIGPINYAGMMAQLDISPVLQAVELRDRRAAVEAQRAQVAAATQLAQNKFTVEMNENAEYRAALEDYSAAPTAEKLRDIGMRFPDHAKALQDGAAAYTEAQRRDVLGTGTAVLGSLSAGLNDQAIKALTERRTALANSGINTDQTDAAIKLIRDGKIDQAKAYLSYAMSGLVGADHMASIMTSLGIGQKAENDDRRLDIAERGINARERQVDASIAATNARLDLSERREARQAAKGSGGGGSGGYEYRIGPDGKLQRRKR